MNTVQELRLTPVYELVEGGWTQARLVEVPGVITAAPSREQAQEMLVDALREFLLSFGPPTNEAAGQASKTGALTVTIAMANLPAA